MLLRVGNLPIVFKGRTQADPFAAIGRVLHQACCLILNSNVPEYHFRFSNQAFSLCSVSSSLPSDEIPSDEISGAWSPLARARAMGTISQMVGASRNTWS